MDRAVAFFIYFFFFFRVLKVQETFISRNKKRIVVFDVLEFLSKSDKEVFDFFFICAKNSLKGISWKYFLLLKYDTIEWLKN